LPAGRGMWTSCRETSMRREEQWGMEEKKRMEE
jgi:hypothetical protein